MSLSLQTLRYSHCLNQRFTRWYGNEITTAFGNNLTCLRAVDWPVVVADGSAPGGLGGMNLLVSGMYWLALMWLSWWQPLPSFGILEGAGREGIRATRQKERVRAHVDSGISRIIAQARKESKKQLYKRRPHSRPADKYAEPKKQKWFFLLFLPELFCVLLVMISLFRCRIQLNKNRCKSSNSLRSMRFRDFDSYKERCNILQLVGLLQRSIRNIAA
jgi:hypothetical protein